MTQTAIENEQIIDEEKKKSSIVSWILYIFVLASTFLLFKYVIGITIINGYSMSPTLSNNDVIVTSNLFYTPKRNDVVVYQDDQGNHIIKRVIALPNETVEIIDGTVYVNNDPVSEPYTAGKSGDMAKITIDQDSYFLIGDNRDPGESLDSRSENVGPITKTQLTGKAIISLYPLNMSFD